MSTGPRYLIAVCDDDPRDRDAIIRLAEGYFHRRSIDHAIKAYDSGQALLAAIEAGERFHLLLSDVMMDKLDGIGLAATLRRQKNDAAIVFISSNREMAIYGYEVSATRFLSKPLNEDKLNEALDHCYQMFQEKREILLPTAIGSRRVTPSEIFYIEAEERGTKVFLANDRIDTRLRIFEQEGLLPQKQFLLCHRAFLVNLAAVKYIRRYELELSNGAVIPISKHRFAFVKDRLLDYLKI